MQTMGQVTLLDRMPARGSEPYWQLYAQFWIKRDATPGYDFHDPAVQQSVSPPTATFSKLLRWWSGDRRARLRALMKLRDQLQQEILGIAVLEQTQTKERSGDQPPGHQIDGRDVGLLMNAPSEVRRTEPVAA